MHLTDQKREEIASRGPWYCFWRYGFLEFGLPIAVGASFIQEVIRTPSSFEFSTWLIDLLLSVLIGGPVAGGLYAFDLWRRVTRQSDKG